MRYLWNTSTREEKYLTTREKHECSFVGKYFLKRNTIYNIRKRGDIV